MSNPEHDEDSEELDRILTYLNKKEEEYKKEYKNIKEYMELAKVNNPIERWAEKTSRVRSLKILFFFCAFLRATIGRIRIRLRHKEQQGPDLRKTAELTKEPQNSMFLHKDKELVVATAT